MMKTASHLADNSAIKKILGGVEVLYKSNFFSLVHIG